MRETQPRRAWQISQVQQLIGLGRRDIQRACYDGRGGAAILSPADSSWGRRTYDVDDLAKLFVVRRFRECGHTLGETRRAFEEAEAAGGFAALLDAEIDHLRERCAEAAEALIQGEALRWAMRDAGARDGGGLSVEDALERLCAQGEAASELAADGDGPACAPAEVAVPAMLALAGHDAAPAPQGEPPAPAPEGAGLDAAGVIAALDAPGMELAVEVLLGTGSYERIRRRAEEALGPSTQEKDGGQAEEG